MTMKMNPYTTEPRERGFGVQPVDVLPGRDQHLGSMTGADRELGDQSARRSGDKSLQHDVDGLDLDGEIQNSLRERAERIFGGTEWVLDVVAVRAEARAALDQRGGGALGDLFSGLSRCCDGQIAELKLRTGAATNRGVPADPQDPDGFDNTGRGLRHDRCLSGESIHRREREGTS